MTNRDEDDEEEERPEELDDELDLYKKTMWELLHVHQIICPFDVPAVSYITFFCEEKM